MFFNLIKKNLTKKILIIFPSFLPILLITGPFLSDLVVSISSLIFLFFALKYKMLNYFTIKPLVLFLIFCLYCILLSILVSEDILLSLESSLFFFRIGIFACVIWYIIEKNKNILIYFYYVLVTCFSILIFDSYCQYFLGYNIIGLAAPAGERISSFFGDELIMGSYLSRLFPLLFALFILKKKRNSEFFFVGVLFILTDVIIFISGERTAFFYLNLSSIFTIILIKQYKKFRVVSFSCAFILIVLLSLSNDKIKNRMISAPLSSMGLVNDSKGINIFTPTHDSLIRTSFKMFLEKPIIGHGPKMYRILCKDKKYQVGVSPCDSHPHNFYVQLLAETGIIGFIFFLSAFFYVIYCSYKQLRSIFFKQKRYLSDYQVCLLAGILITVWPFSPNGNFFNNWLAITYSMPVGFYLHSIYGKNKDFLFSK